jgi:PilZ domain-containing protein
MSEQKTEDKLTDQSMATVHLKERREVRYDVELKIEVSGIDQEGQAFHERTVTRDVSEWGCGFLVSTELKVDDMIAIRMSSPDQEGTSSRPQCLYQVLRVKREGTRWLVGSWKMGGSDIWGSDLPKSAQSEGMGQEARAEGTIQGEGPPRKDSDR